MKVPYWQNKTDRWRKTATSPERGPPVALPKCPKCLYRLFGHPTMTSALPPCLNSQARYPVS